MRQITKIIVHCSATPEGKTSPSLTSLVGISNGSSSLSGITTLSTTTADQKRRLEHIVLDTTLILSVFATSVEWLKMGKLLKILGHLRKNSPLSASLSELQMLHIRSFSRTRFCRQMLAKMP